MKDLVQRFGDSNSGKQHSKTKILIIGGIHGDEISGIQALERLSSELQNGNIQLHNCTIDIIPIANELAYKTGTRYMEYNLNRLFTQEILNYQGNSYEKNRAKSIAEQMNREKYDFILDLHSTSNPSVPFLFCEKQNLQYFQTLGIPYIVSGRSSLSDSAVTGDTESYGNNLGSVACTFEAGSHLDPLGTEFAYMFVTSFLSNKDCILDHGKIPKNQNDKSIIVTIKNTYVCKNATFKYSVEPRNFISISEHECIGYDGNIPVYSDYNGYLIMPKKSELIKTGIECFFIGI